ncbi:MAG: shikimate kinase [Phycisphaerae bacterium]
MSGVTSARAMLGEVPVALIGLRGAGKSAVGRALAAVLHWDFVDTDERVEQRAGKSIAAIFAENGEAYFRELESAVLRDVLTPRRPCVLSLGGGAILREENRDLLQATCRVVLLTAPAQVLAARIAADGATAAQRPALTSCDSLVEELQTLWRRREQHYHAVAHLQCNTEGRTVAEIVAEIMDALTNTRSDASR